MENVTYVALSRQLTLRRELDIVANNVANMDTVGFKVEELLTGTEAGARARNDGLRAPTAFVLAHGVGRDFGQGELRRTEAPLDLALQGEGFFQVETDQGPRFTRDGRFATDTQGRLVTQQGWPVMGEGGEIVLDPKKASPSISEDGIVMQDGERVGRIAVFRFAALGALSKDGDSLFANRSNQQPEPALDTRIRQGSVESSNVKPIVEITRLVELTRSYERVTRMIEQSNDLSRRSVERLGRVS